MDEAACILTVDVEDWFHILDGCRIRASAWSSLPSCVVGDTSRLLDILGPYGARGTFFLVGWVAREYPGIVREIVRRGHAIGSHGYFHVPPDEMTTEEFLRDVRDSKALLEDLSGAAVRGYRAPGFRVRNSSFPFEDLLAESGYRFDASGYPGWFPGRGLANGRRAPHAACTQQGTFWEVPVSTLHACGIRIAFSGGGSLRLFPSWVTRWGERQAQATGTPVVYYLHPRDLNPDTPTIPAAAWRRVRYYGGRRGMAEKLRRICARRRLVSVEDYLGLDAGGTS